MKPYEEINERGLSVAQPIEILRCPQITLGSCCSSRYRRKLPLSISLPSKSAFRHVSAAILTSHHHQRRDFCFPYRMKFLLMTFFGPLDADKLNISKPHRGHSATTRVPSGRSICTLHPPGIQCSGFQPNYRTSPPFQAVAIKSNRHGSI